MLLAFLPEPAPTPLRRLAQENGSTARHGGGEPPAARLPEKPEKPEEPEECGR
ncbi:hypothetical protein ACF07S_21150 [Streptomyces sp. NPDC016640]|uniref:hypothetical protein n=1 Tax=Streptomyces sp. NPDC016640 TaxID=3364969 RepID=UPI0037027BEE